MSYTIETYAVDLGQLQKLFGSHHRELINKIKKSCQSRIKELDEDEREPDCNEALEAFFQGTNFKQKYASKYGYAFGLICSYLGKKLSSELSCTFISELDDVLVFKKIKDEFSIHRLVGEDRGLYIPLPKISKYSFPGIGYMTLKEIKEALKCIKATNFSDLSLKHQKKLGKYFMKQLPEVIAEITFWLETAMKMKRGLICFFY